jgi:hypothetical protein
MAEQMAEAPALAPAEGIKWLVDWKIEKFRVADLAHDPHAAPYETISEHGNLLTYGGASALWDLLIGAGTVTAFDNANAYLGVGDSSTAAAATQTDLQASTNKHREAMDATYPLHTDGTGSSSNASIAYKSTYETGDANFTWSEWALFNASTSGRMLNRKVFTGGTKTSSDTWSLTVTITLA